MIGVLAGATGLLIAALLLSQQAYSAYSVRGWGVGVGCAGSACPDVGAGAGAGPRMMHLRGRGWHGPRENFTATVEEVQLAGRLVELDKGFLVIESGGGRIAVRTPMWLVVDNQTVSLLKLAFEDRLNMGDEVRIVANRVTVTRADGSQTSFYVLKELIDLTTGLEASNPRGRLAPPTSSA